MHATLLQWIDDYVAKQHAALMTVEAMQIDRFIQFLRQAWLDDRAVFVIGNGGSAANASHFAVDLGKTASGGLPRRFRVMALTCNVPWITAAGNDCSYEDTFVNQLQSVARTGDVLVTLSVSGRSPNIIKAVQWANGNELKTIALVGGNGVGIRELADLAIVVNDSHYGRVEDVQMHVLHMVCYAFVECAQLH